ncbi:11060_t:CDS:10 [Dentiscutata erythropus]|uniref:phospholipase D n=1 Tax=Dentiscutata erythropus TaxID=1348616 RepID=A0A9N9BNC8_9GLOM|nr:11060_t:CDS:10 [Dentiscutata erythropus]
MVDFIEETATKVVNFFAGESSSPADIPKTFRYDSFAKVREKAFAKWYVNGKDYFYAVSEAISNAKREIFIEDWWLSPELYLRRPPYKNEHFRLDKLLKRKAKEGVKVYVVLYRELEQALTLNSKHSKQVLISELDENILVQRHPAHGIDGTFFWAHHEKICVIDRHIAFIGGLDLCLGRYDTGRHQLADFSKISDYYSIWPGQDYSNPRVFDFIEVDKCFSKLIDKNYVARMPWQDVSMGFVGKPAQDVAEHFIQRWNFIKKKKNENKIIYPVLIAKSDAQYNREYMKEHNSLVREYTSCGKTVNLHPDEGTCCIQVLRSSAAWSLGLSQTEHSIQNAYIDVITNAKHFIYIENQFFITATKYSADFPVKNQIGKAIVDRILRAHKNNEKFRVIVIMPLIPGFPAELNSSDAGVPRLVMHYQYTSICRGGHSIIETLIKSGCANPHDYIGFYALRNYDKIVHPAVKCGLGVLDYEIDAPALEKWYDNPNADPSFKDYKYSKSQQHHHQRPHIDENDCTYVTEELYIHSKLLIADDRIVIMGSANLNDRSQNGDHDSEIAAVIEDKNYIQSRMAGGYWQAGKFAATLRRHIFKQHLGLEVYESHDEVNTHSHPPPIESDYPVDPQNLSHADRIVEDPLSEEFYEKYWWHTASQNTESFRKVFHCYPDDTVTNWDEFNAFVPDRKKVPLGHITESARQNMEQTKAELQKIKGHLVLFPLNFLRDVTLSGSVVFDAVTPMELFT